MTIKKALSLGLLATVGMVVATSCNDDWKDEQYEHYIGFKAPLDTQGASVGVTTVYVPFTRLNSDLQPMYGPGQSHYDLPVIISGSSENKDNFTVNIAHSDTLPILNKARMGERTELYYQDMWDFADVPSTIRMYAGNDIELLRIKFDFNGLDLTERYVLPITVANGAGYKRNPRKNYATAMLRILPYTTYSGNYQAQRTQFFILDEDGNRVGDPGSMDTKMCYTVDENTVFFYAGQFDEKSQLRKHFKVYAKFIPKNDEVGTVKLWSDIDEMEFEQIGEVNYTISEKEDAVQTHIHRRYVLIEDLNYRFTDNYTARMVKPDGTVVTSPIRYNVSGSMIMERKLNTQMPEEDQVVWDE
jgi:hypothetical protein